MKFNMHISCLHRSAYDTTCRHVEQTATIDVMWQVVHHSLILSIISTMLFVCASTLVINGWIKLLYIYIYI